MPYVALEYLEGQDLRERIFEDRPSVPEALRITLAIAEAIARHTDTGSFIVISSLRMSSFLTMGGFVWSISDSRSVGVSFRCERDGRV